MIHLLILALVPRDGGWGKWSSWTVCDKGCDGGKRMRHRFCNNPFPQHGGAECPGLRHQTEDCNTEDCPGECKVVKRICDKCANERGFHGISAT